MTAEANDTKRLLLAGANGCTLLAGKLATPRLAGHLVELTGQLLDATASDPRTLTIETVITVGERCAQTCTLEPPGHRGLHKREKPGTQGGTPGQ